MLHALKSCKIPSFHMKPKWNHFLSILALFISPLLVKNTKTVFGKTKIIKKLRISIKSLLLRGWEHSAVKVLKKLTSDLLFRDTHRSSIANRVLFQPNSCLHKQQNYDATIAHSLCSLKNGFALKYIQFITF